MLVVHVVIVCLKRDNPPLSPLIRGAGFTDFFRIGDICVETHQTEKHSPVGGFCLGVSAVSV